MRQLGAGSCSGKREKQENGTDGNGKKKKEREAVKSEGDWVNELCREKESEGEQEQRERVGLA